MRSGTVLVVIGVMSVLSVGPGSTTPHVLADTPLPLRIGYQSTSADDWLLFAARDLKLFEKVGLAPEYTPFEAGPTIIAAAMNKSIDVAIVKAAPFLEGLSQGVDWVMIGIYSEGAYSEGLLTRKDSGIDTPSDLKGKRIGYYRGSSAHYGLRMILRQYGIARDQVNLLHMAPAEQATALANGEIDAAMVWEPWIQKMIHEANARIIATEGDVGIYTNVASISVRQEWLRDNREKAVRFVEGLIMAYDALQKDNGVAVRAVAEGMGIKKEWVEQIYRDAPPAHVHLWADRQYPYSIVKGSAFHRRLRYVAKFMFDEKMIPKEVELGDVLDASVAIEAFRNSKQGQ
jgi:aliphatic sulfonates family ABC transporter substrate-binding protein